MSGRAAVGTAPSGIAWPGLAVILALLGGCVLLAEALLADLLFGFNDPASSSLRTVLLLAIGALVASGAALLLRSAPRLASLLFLLAVTLAGVAQWPFFVYRLGAPYWGPAFPLYRRVLDLALAPLLAWLFATVPLACATVLVWH